MERPGWAIALGIIMLLMGGCGAYNDYQNIHVEKIMNMKDKIIKQIDEDHERNMKKTTNMESRDTTQFQNDSLFGEPLVKDSLNNADIGKTFETFFDFSDYRLLWTKRCGYIGLFVSFLFLIGGLLFLLGKKYVVPIIISILAISIAFGIFQILIFSADPGSGKMLQKLGNLGYYVSIFIDILILIIFMVVDKSFFKKQELVEDYYD